jgi:hypothetical protein
LWAPRSTTCAQTHCTDGGATCGVDVDRAHRRPLVASPVEHALSDNREYLIGALEDGWWLAVEVDAKLTTLASPVPSEEAAKERAEAWEG